MGMRAEAYSDVVLVGDVGAPEHGHDCALEKKI